MANEAHFSVVGFVATLPKSGMTKTGTPTLSMRVGWTPRIFDRSTSEWTDQPSSFITVQCYKKAAEHGYVCLRRGDPVVVRGTLRVREYVDQNGVRRSSVEVHADSIGHDLSRGIALFKKTQAQLEQTAYENERAMAAAEGRNPLPGDREAAEPGREPAEPDGEHDTEQGAETSDARERSLGNASATDAGDGHDPEFGASDPFDEDDGRGITAELDEAPEPVGAMV
jgi:single-stranded DNA-binding protein